jgi:HEAT repeat protein
MPVSATVFETQFLYAIIIGTLGLTGASLTVLMGLIIWRMVTQRREKRILRRTHVITRCLYAALKSPVALTTASLLPITAADHLTVMQAALNVLRSVRGDDTHIIVRVLELWSLSPYLYKTAASGSNGRRIQALTLLGYFSNRASLDILLEHAADTGIYVQLAALRSLALRKATVSMEQIVQCLTHAGQTNTPMLSDILQRFGEPAVPALVALALSPATTDIRLAALMALGKISSLNGVMELIALTEDQNMDIRAQAIRALGKIGDSRAAETIALHLKERNTTVRLQAVQALGQLHLLATLPQLAASLADDEWWVRFRAAEALYHFGEKGIAALRALGAQNNRSGLIARQVLAERAGGV